MGKQAKQWGKQGISAKFLWINLWISRVKVCFRNIKGQANLKTNNQGLNTREFWNEKHEGFTAGFSGKNAIISLRLPAKAPINRL